MSGKFSEVLCVIPARGGSRRLPRKNLARIGGVTLVARAVLSAQDFLARPDAPAGRVVVDTDSAEIAEEARGCGAEVPFLRPASLAADSTTTEDSLRHLFGQLGWRGPVALLQPTSPLRSADDIAACWDAFRKSDGTPAVSVTEVPAHASRSFELTSDGRIGESHESGSSGSRFRLTGAVYVFNAEDLSRRERIVVPNETIGVPVVADRSADVDTATDLVEAEAALRARQVAPLRFGGKVVGDGEPVFIIAEAGVNHNGDPALAHRLVDIAADAGADCVKFQSFEPELLASGSARKAAYQIENTGEAVSQLDMLRSLTLPREVVRELAAHAEERGIMFLSTPFDSRSADFLLELGVKAFKVPSGEVTNFPFLAHLSRMGLPLLVSTGMSTMAEVAAALREIRANGDPGIALFHAVTQYPAPMAECNLRAMVSMRETFGLPVGWSDHTQGVVAPLAAVALGAAMIEKHFTTSRELPGPDHPAALEPDELGEMVAGIRAVSAALGDGVKRPAPSEAANIPLVRRSLHAARALAAGHTLTPDDLVALRPATGIPPTAWSRVMGRRLRDAVPAGAALDERHLA